MNQLPVLLKREFQEHLGALCILPLIVTGFFVLMMMVSVLSDQLGGDVNVKIQAGEDASVVSGDEGLTTLFEANLLELAGASPEERRRKFTAAANAVTSPVLLVLWIVVFFYLLGALYDERKDRSILFWKSMPVSDTMTVVSKLLTAVIIAPGIYLLAIAVVHVVGMLVLTVLARPYPVDIWAVLWQPANPFLHWGMLVLYFLFAALWCLPFFGWMLFVSAFARSLPFLWAIGVPVALVIVEWMLLRDSVVKDWMSRHSTDIAYGDRNALGIEEMLSRMASVELLVSLIIGLALLYGAVHLRGRGDEI